MKTELQLQREKKAIGIIIALYMEYHNQSVIRAIEALRDDLHVFQQYILKEAMKLSFIKEAEGK